MLFMYIYGCVQCMFKGLISYWYNHFLFLHKVFFYVIVFELIVEPVLEFKMAYVKVFIPKNTFL